MEEEIDPKPFYKAVHSFYAATLKKMLKKFPFGESMLKDLGIINPDNVCNYSFSTIESIASRFPQLGLAETLDNLREEFMDFTLSPEDHPSVFTNKTRTGDKPRAGVFWCEVGKLRTLDGEPSLAKLMAGLLSIPA